MPEITVREAAEADLASLAQIDVSYTAGERILSLRRSGTSPELTFSLRWRAGTPVERVYDELTVDGLRRALTKGADLFLVAEVEGRLTGYLMVVLPRWTDAGEITDVVVDRPLRRRGVGRALVQAATEWARDRGLRALWVEPGADHAEAIEFYLSLGFRLSGLNDRWTSNDKEGHHTVYMYLELGY